MPHLRFELSADLTADGKREFAAWVTDRYAEIMETGTGHVAVSVRECEPAALSLGRVVADEQVAFLNADVRAGRSADQRRTLATTIMDELHDRWAIPTANTYVIYTEHPGEDFLLREGPLETWSSDERSPADP